MDNFEKRLLLGYMEKLADDLDVKGYNFDNFFDFFIEDFSIPKNRFQFDEDGELVTYKKIHREQFIKTLKAVIGELKQKIPVRQNATEKKLNLLKSIYKLDDDEFALFTFITMKDINNMFDVLYDCLSRDRFSTFCRNCFNIRVNRRGRVMDSLYMKSLIDSTSGDADVSPQILKIFDSDKCNSEKAVVSALLGEPTKASLTNKDYAHFEEERQKVEKIIRSAVNAKTKGINILLYGEVGTGKTEFAKLIAKNAKVRMFSVRIEQEEKREADRCERLIDLHSKQDILSRSSNNIILFDEAEDVMNRGFTAFGRASKSYMNNILEETPVPVIWTTNNIKDVDPAFLRRMTYAIEFEKLSEKTRLDIWKKILKKNDLKVNETKLKELNKTYDISPSIISNAVKTTKLTGGNENDFEGYIENIAKIVKKRKNVKTPKDVDLKLYDINLVNADTDVEDLTEKIKNCGNLNFSICMYGEPGTGKSLYARYLAKELGIEVIQKRASDLMSMWVGGTEHLIAAAFEEAKKKKAMLIFDEADSFLQNRGSANHSWEVSEVNEMLTWMESHEYPFICTTNLLDTLDEASLRRFTFKIKFDFMKPEQIKGAMKLFFDIENAGLNIKGLTAGDFATVKKKVDFLKITELAEIEKMLRDEVKLKNAKELKNSIGF